VESWKPVWMLSSKMRAERVEFGREVVWWRGVEVPLAVAGVEVPSDVVWSVVRKLTC
jgi:hypothetical protein